MHVDLLKVYKLINEHGGYDKVSDEKLAWRNMVNTLGLFSSNEASAAYSLKLAYYKNLAAYEITTIHKREPPPPEILEFLSAKGGSLLTRTMENFGYRIGRPSGAAARLLRGRATTRHRAGTDVAETTLRRRPGGRLAACARLLRSASSSSPTRGRRARRDTARRASTVLRRPMGGRRPRPRPLPNGAFAAPCTHPSLGPHAARRPRSAATSSPHDTGPTTAATTTAAAPAPPAPAPPAPAAAPAARPATRLGRVQPPSVGCLFGRRPKPTSLEAPSPSTSAPSRRRPTARPSSPADIGCSDSTRPA